MFKPHVVEHPRAPHRRRPHGLPHRVPIDGRLGPASIAESTASAMASATRGTARNEAPTEKPVAGWM